MALSKMDEIRIKAWLAKVRGGSATIDDVPEAYRDEVRRRLEADGWTETTEEA